MRAALASAYHEIRNLQLRMVRDFLLLSGGELFSKLIGFAAFAYLARTLDPAAYGAVELVISFSVFFALIVEFGLSPTRAREVARDADCARNMAGEIPFARFLVAMLAVPAMCGTVVAFDLPPDVIRLACVFSLGLLAIPFRQQWLFQGLEMMEWVSLAQILRMSTFAIGIFCFVHSTNDLMWVGVVELVAAFALAAYFYVVQGRKVTPFRPSIDLPGLTRLLREGFFIGLGRVAWAVNQYLPVMLIALLLGSVEVAFFGAAHRIVMSLVTFTWLYHFNLYPAMSKSLSESPEAYRALVEPSVNASAWGGIGLALVLTLLADDLCLLVFGEAFRGAGPTLAVLVWTLPVWFVSGHARWALIARGEQRCLAIAQAAGVVSTLLVGGFAISWWGTLGAAITMIVSAIVVSSVAHAYVVQRICRLPLLSAIARPALAALAVGLAAQEFDAPPWVEPIAAGLVFAALGPLLDRTLIRDLRTIATAKDVAAPREAPELGLSAVV